MASEKAVHRTPLCFALNDNEQKLLHHYLIRRHGREAQSSRPQTEGHVRRAALHDDYHAATVRSSLRVFLATAAGLKAWELASITLQSRGISQRSRPKRPLLVSPTFRLALSLSSILFLHRSLHRFFIRLRLRLLKEKASKLRARYPKVFRGLTSHVAPAIGASLAGFALGIHPSDQLRITITIYMGARALEILYNVLEREGYLRGLPWWFGSWMLFPLAQGQLFHAFVFDRDCCPKVYDNSMLEYTPSYLQRRPPNVARSLRWPTTDQITGSLAEMARLKWPPFISPILHPANLTPLPPRIDPAISPITSRAHPSIPQLSCALLHPSNPSCFFAYLSHNIPSFPRLARVFTIFYGALAVPQYRRFLDSPVSSINRLAKSILKTTAAISGAIGASWGSICLFAAIFPRTFLPRLRLFLGGFLGGCFQFLDRTAAGRTNSLYVTRMSADSLWKVGVKHGWWKGIRGGDVVLFVASLALLNIVYELKAKVVDDRDMQLVMRVLRGDEEIGLQDTGRMKRETKAL
ncbi:hypothetical protein GJ744_008656 [Endocarpon pusillum]|uniref:Uncharacterized protein n=1 Tax=Endocarpon pusillum TaxID=364733 RepID=A0A8H7E345_9EURO|nr:hypothetical protein GJ744_008656 [Endocarpon pusillum]